MSKTTPKPMLTTEQIEHINAVLTLLTPGTKYGPMSIKGARHQLAGEGFDNTQIDALLDLRSIELKHA